MSRRLPAALLILFTLLLAQPVRAGGPDYGIPAGFVLPWDCGPGYRVTWEPAPHWEFGKASGIAWDFSLPAGTPLVAPLSGTAYFRSDERPLETTYGHYVEIIDTSGYWLVRLAHLQEPQYGERFVHAGELIGYSGASGVPSAHLHLELLVRDGTRWVRPDPYTLQGAYGLPVQELVTGALVSRDGCQLPIELTGPVTALQDDITLGEPFDLRVPLYNVSPDALTLDLVQVSLFSAGGDRMLAEAQGAWPIEGGADAEITLSAVASVPGPWYIGRVSYHAHGVATGIPARGQFEVNIAPLHLLGFTLPETPPAVGDRAMFEVWVQNASFDALTLEGLVLEGLRPDGVPWQATLASPASPDDPVTLEPGVVQSFALMMCAPLQQVGYWTADRLAYVQDGNRLVFAQLETEMQVYGPQLEVAEFTLYHSNESAFVLMRLENVGTEVAQADALEVWGWKPNGESFSSRLMDVAPLEAGQSALVQVQVPLEASQGFWRFVEAGYWLRGAYLPMMLPGQPAVSVMVSPGHEPRLRNALRLLS